MDRRSARRCAPGTSLVCNSIPRRATGSGSDCSRTLPGSDMLRPRIIPCLLLKGGALVKTVRFADLRYVGDPVNAVKIFNEKEADELIVLDIEATTTRREPNYRLISQIAVECRMPL